MDWSASLSLSHRTPSAPVNYGSCRTPGVRIPQSIPEHSCVVQFMSPHDDRARHLLDQYARSRSLSSYQNSSSSNSTKGSSNSMTMTELSSRRAKTFKMMLLSTTSSVGPETPVSYKERQYLLPQSQQQSVNLAAPSASHPAARAAHDDDTGDDDDFFNNMQDHQGNASSYWLQERERRRCERERRHSRCHRPRCLPGIVSPLKPDSASDPQQQLAGWKSAAIMFSVPVVLVIVFLVLVFLVGDDEDATAAATMATPRNPPLTHHHHLRAVLGALIPSAPSS